MPPPPDAHSSTSDQSFLFPSRSGLARRHSTAAHSPPPPASSAGRGPIHVDVDPPPKTKPIFQLLAFALIIFFSALQFLPATHLRDPTDPFRGTWIPVVHHGSSVSNSVLERTAASVDMHIASWIDCIDVRVLAVFINSTMTSTRSPENVYFHFFLHGKQEEKMSFYKLKVLFPDSNIDIMGQKEIKKRVAIAVPEIKHIWPIPPALAPFIIPRIKPSVRRFAYMPQSAIVKGDIDDLFSTDLGLYPIAAVEDCYERLHDHVNIEIVNAVQRTAAKKYVSKEPYDGNACLPDLTILLLDARGLEKSLLEGTLWWNKVLGKSMNDGEVSHSVILAIYNKFMKLSPSWKLSDGNDSHPLVDTNVYYYDGPRMHCSTDGNLQQTNGFGDNWRQHISLKSEIILSH